MNKEFYDKYSNGLKCYGCDYLLQCKKANRPILAKCIPNMNYVDKIIGLESKLAESEKKYETLYKLFSEQHEIIDQMELECFDEVNRLLKEQKDFYIVEKTEYEKMKQGAKEIIDQLKQQLQEEKNRNKKLNHEAQKYYEDAYCNGFQNKKAIEQLGIVKEWLEPKYFDKEQINYLAKAINQQIKSLKGEK